MSEEPSPSSLHGPGLQGPASLKQSDTITSGESDFVVIDSGQDTTDSVEQTLSAMSHADLVQCSKQALYDSKFVREKLDECVGDLDQMSRKYKELQEDYKKKRDQTQETIHKLRSKKNATGSRAPLRNENPGKEDVESLKQKVCEYVACLEELNQQNETLEKENEELKLIKHDLESKQCQIELENRQLKSEIERLKANPVQQTQPINSAQDSTVECPFGCGERGDFAFITAHIDRSHPI